MGKKNNRRTTAEEAAETNGVTDQALAEELGVEELNEELPAPVEEEDVLDQTAPEGERVLQLRSIIFSSNFNNASDKWLKYWFQTLENSSTGEVNTTRHDVDLEVKGEGCFPPPPPPENDAEVPPSVAEIEVPEEVSLKFAFFYYFWLQVQSSSRYYFV